MIGNFLQNIHFNGKNYNGNNGDKGKISYRFAEQLGLSIYHRAVKTGLSVGVDALVRLPDEVFSKLLYKQLKNLRYQESTKFMMKLARELKRRYSQFHPNVRRRFVENLFGNEMLLSDKKHQRVADKLGDWPVTMVVSPTMRCNLTCEGCYSAHYHRKDGMDTETFDRVLTQAKEMGIYFVVISGGEPFIRKDLLEIFRRHQDMLFMTYTNGIIIHDRNLAPRLAELGNVLPTISVEGFEDETNKRRGKGVYNKVIGAMNQLRDHGVIFGFSATPMRHNSDLLVTDEFVEFYEKLGAFFGWYFSYMPVGRNPDLSLMPTVEQRLRRYSRIRELREKYRVVMADFWCDGGLSGGCLSAGRNYFHVNSQGGVEPCVFHQFWVDKIQDKSLLEAIDSPYFRFLREKLAQKDNPLTPCPIIDHPEILQEAYKHFQPNASNEGAETIVTELCQGLNHYSCKVKKAFDPIWEQEKTDNYWHWRQKMGPKEGLHQEKTGKIIDFLRRKANF